MRRTSLRRVILAAALVGGVVVLASAGGAVPAVADTAAQTVRVTLDEFTLRPVPRSTSSRRVTFVARNAGTITHELVVIRTTKAPGKLPLVGSRASERGRVGEISSIAPGKTKRLTLTLASGKYVLICNLRGHYLAGQYAGFTIG
jgi:uncharacterized cupredoxin-like copper-binding protein